MADGSSVGSAFAEFAEHDVGSAGTTLSCPGASRVRGRRPVGAPWPSGCAGRQNQERSVVVLLDLDYDIGAGG
jgi:hypothetical protein